MNKENIKRSLDLFEDDNFLEAKKILQEEIKSKISEYISEKTNIKQLNESLKSDFLKCPGVAVNLQVSSNSDMSSLFDDAIANKFNFFFDGRNQFIIKGNKNKVERFMSDNGWDPSEPFYFDDVKNPLERAPKIVTVVVNEKINDNKFYEICNTLYEEDYGFSVDLKKATFVVTGKIVSPEGVKSVFELCGLSGFEII